ncbi:499_t:CDS:2 [Entrophospora sp. SA101]|nr:499_t:CDS:2 [Entrophospora sp. SA101]
MQKKKAFTSGKWVQIFEELDILNPNDSDHGGSHKATTSNPNDSDGSQDASEYYLERH